ncbi:MAG: SAM-dependent methyltransferase [Myxococcota bacterium]|jgi:protein-L-isoaspartate O-methyltransferase|nr:SAM-dependent methyltransferase [Myxococcota bacterium]
MLPQRLIRSQQLSFFRQRAVLFLYHELYGYLIELSADLCELLDAFQDGASVAEVEARFAERFGTQLLFSALQSFVEHRCLLPCEDAWASLEEQEIQGLFEKYPIKASWIVVFQGKQAIVARNLATPPRRVDFEAFEQELWARLDGTRSVRELAQSLSQSWPNCDARTAKTLTQWTNSELQLCRMLDAPRDFFRHVGLPAYALSTMPFERCENPAQSPERAINSAYTHEMVAYHQEIADAEQQFESLETTLSHLFREPHPALGGQRYGERALSHLRAAGLWTQRCTRVLELGGGLGYFACAILDTLRETEPELYARTEYTILELSPELQRAQRERLRSHPKVRFVLEDVAQLAQRDERYELVLSNEVLADLPHALVSRIGASPELSEWEDPDALLEAAEEDLESCFDTDPQTAALLERYPLELSAAPARFLLNVGAIRLLEALPSVLAEGGAAWLSEFGDRWRYPVECLHLDHAEVSIHFGHLLQVAVALGFDAELVDIFDALAFDGQQLMLATTQSWWRNFTFLLAERGVQLKKLALTPQSLAQACAGSFELEELETLRWQPLEERVAGLQPREFKALILRSRAGYDS